MHRRSAECTILNASALRYYEEVGLISPAVYPPSGDRIYEEQAQELLTLIRRCHDFGFSIEQTRLVVHDW